MFLWGVIDIEDKTTTTAKNVVESIPANGNTLSAPIMESSEEALLAAQQSTSVTKHSRKKRVVAFVLAFLLVLAVLAGIFVWVQHTKLMQAIESGNHTQAVEIMDCLPFFRKMMPLEYEYSFAMVLLQQGNLERSLRIFEYLGNFKDSKYYYDNLTLYLGAANRDTDYGKFSAYRSLGDFLDSKKQMALLVPGVRQEGIGLYLKNEIDFAMQHFEAIEEYVTEFDPYYAACKICCEFEENIWAMEAAEARDLVFSLEKYETEYGIEIGHAVLDGYMFGFFLDGLWVSVDGKEIQLDYREDFFYTRGIVLPEATFAAIDGAFIDIADGEEYIVATYISWNEIELDLVLQDETCVFYRLI